METMALMVLVGFGADTAAYRSGNALILHHSKGIVHVMLLFLILAFRSLLIVTSVQFVFSFVTNASLVWESFLMRKAWTFFAAYIGFRMIWNALLMTGFDIYASVTQTPGRLSRLRTNDRALGTSFRESFDIKSKELGRLDLVHAWIRFSVATAIVALFFFVDEGLAEALWFTQILSSVFPS